MRKKSGKFLVLLAAVLLMVLAACGGGSEWVYDDDGGRVRAERDSALVGRWRDGDNTIEFSGDGTGTATSGTNVTEITWHTQDGRLFLSYGHNVSVNLNLTTRSYYRRCANCSLTDRGVLSCGACAGNVQVLDRSRALGVKVSGTQGEIYGEWLLPRNTTRSAGDAFFDLHRFSMATQHFRHFDIQDLPVRYVFNRDGSGVWRHQDYERSFTWIQDGNSLTRTWLVDTSYDYSVSDSGLTIFFGTYGLGMTVSPSLFRGTTDFVRLGGN